MSFMSKQVKHDYMSVDEDESRLKKLRQEIGYKINRLTRPIRRFYHFLLKLAAYGKVLWNDFDWEAAYLYPLIELKLTRIHKALKEGHLIQDEQHMHALELAIKLCKRVSEDGEYYDRPLRRHDGKWGKSRMSWKKSKDGRGSIMSSRRAKAKTPRQKNKERKEFVAAYTACDALRDRDRKIMFSIMAKYMPLWWD